MGIHGRVYSGACLLVVPSSFRHKHYASIPEGNPRIMITTSMERLVNADLWLCGLGHFVILIASFQVPLQLKWKEDLQQLMPFNRKLLWVQSSFTVLTIIAFGVLTLALHNELLRGDRSAMGLAAFIGLYWTGRVLVDAFYFSHSDWPQGARFVIGHLLLTALFCFLAASYLALFAWNVWLRYPA
jgi:RsiW-degrading membrane proteinase PrsW (M82 family)